MKISTFFTVGFILVSVSVFGQEAASKLSVGADLFNRYIWRGSDYGNSPVVQPSIKYAAGGFSVGAWGSYSLSANYGATEADLFMGYSFKNGFSLFVTDYYFPSEPGSTGNYFDYSQSHVFEASAGQSIGKFTITGNWVFANADNDLYVETGYAFKPVSIFLGAGNKSYSQDGDFNLVNLGISVIKTISVTDNFSLPLTGKVIVNPDREQIFLVIGLSL